LLLCTSVFYIIESKEGATIQQIHLFWLGNPGVQVNGQPIKLETRKVLALLTYLSMSEEGCSREFLTTLFWPEYDQQHAFGNFRRALSSLNKGIDPEFLDISREALGLKDPSNFWLDVHVFNQLVTRAKAYADPENESCPDCISTLEQAVQLYRGDFLAGFNLRDCPEFDSWQLLQRYHWHQEFSMVLEKLSGIYASQASWPQSIAYARRRVALDPLNESGQAALVRLYNQSGQRNSAVRQYDEYARTLEKELGQSPEIDLQELLVSSRPAGPSNINQSKTPSNISLAIDPLLKTKLFIPPYRAGVHRKHLVDVIEMGTKSKLTLISAPAGFGKTTLLSEWVGKCQDLIAWFSLDPGDNDLYRFLRHLLAGIDLALERMLKKRQNQEFEQVRAALALIGQAITEQQLPPRSILDNIANCLIDLCGPIILILDDYQFIDNQAIHEAISFLLEHSPAPVRLVIATRSDPNFPLARLRIRNQLVEIRADNLRFSPEEAREYLNQIMKLNLSTEQISVLENRTEGWIAGLQMAAIALRAAITPPVLSSDRDRPDLSQFIRSFSGSHRYILEYLAEEVLIHQPQEIRDFLLCTSILDRLCSSLCSEVLNGDETNSSLPISGQPISWKTYQQILEYLERTNLFIVPLDDEQYWYRYHHLFAELLQNRLRQENNWEMIAGLHYRASCWFERHQFFDEAISHALVGKHYQRAASLIEENIEPLLSHINFLSSMTWFQSMPQDLFQEHPWVAVTKAWVLVATGRIAELDQLLPNLEMKVRGQQPNREDKPLPTGYRGNQDLLANISALQAYSGFFRGNLNLAVDKGCLAMQLASKMNFTLRARISTMLGESYLVDGQMEDAERHLREAIRLNLEVLDLNTTIVAYIRLGTLYKVRGQLSAAFGVFNDAFQLLDRLKSRLNPLAGMVEVGMADVLRERDDLEEARQMLVQALEKLPQLGKPYEVIYARISMARVLISQRDLDGAAKNLGAIEAMLQTLIPPPTTRATLNNCKVFLYRAKEDIQRLTQLTLDLVSQLTNQISPVPIYVDENNRVTLARSLLAVQHDHLVGIEDPVNLALQVLQPIIGPAELNGRTGRLIEILVLQSLAYWAQGNRAMALHSLAKCMELAEPEGYSRVFIDEGEPLRSLLSELQIWIQQQLPAETSNRLITYTRLLLADFGTANSEKNLLTRHQKSSNDDLIEPLSDRELEVLQLICAGCSNREIAGKLFISENTVKRHNNNIFGKMGVNSRVQAITRALQLGLIIHISDDH
jgi:LuxR family maltose regulon positive regulatory protein